MSKIKAIKLIFYFTALLLAAKPFVGFGVFGHINSPVKTNIFVKIFSKRTQVGSNADQAAVQQILAEQASFFFLRFGFLLAILFPLLVAANGRVTNGFLQGIKLGLLPTPFNPINGQLLI